MTFKEKYTLSQRTTESQKIREKYPDRVPVIAEKMEGSRIERIDKEKYLVPADLTCAQFILVIRKKLPAHSETQSLRLYIKNTIPNMTSSMMTLYDANKDEDGFLYVNFKEEDAFGCCN